MNNENYDLAKLMVGVLGTVGLYSVLYRENKFYRFFEHMFLGLAAGWMMVALWSETLKENWYDLMVGRMSDTGTIESRGYYLWAILLPIGFMGYMVFSRKHAWMSRVPIGIIIGLWSGQQFQAWSNRYFPQMEATMKPIIPNEGFFRPVTAGMTKEQIDAVNANVYGSQAIINLIALITVLAVLSYFIFSINFKSKFMMGATKLGRYLLMIGFGAIFGSTVMMRFTLLIDRMYYIFIEFITEGIVQRFFGGGG